MNYRKIPQIVADKLKPLEAYIYLVLASKSDYETNESNVNEDTLAELTGLRREAISKHICDFDKKGIIKKITERRKGERGTFRFNHYYLFTEHYALVSMDLLKEPIRRELMGFLVQLKLRCYNFSNLCRYSVRALADTFVYSKSTVERYLQEAESSGYIKRDKKGIRLLNSNLFIIDEKSEYEFVREFYPESLTDEEILNHKLSSSPLRW
ncbi:MAG: MarR family transcriptional regulator [Prevotella sp.]|nr:MarR family transcriptional regulator [Prevotella sp.]